MAVIENLLDKIEKLPVDKQLEVLDFVEFLLQKNQLKGPLRSARGLLADLNIHITEEDIAEARKEMWGNFPREDIKGVEVGEIDDL